MSIIFLKRMELKPFVYRGFRIGGQKTSLGVQCPGKSCEGPINEETISALLCRSQVYGKKLLRCQKQEKEVARTVHSNEFADSLNRNVW